MIYIFDQAVNKIEAGIKEAQCKGYKVKYIVMSKSTFNFLCPYVIIDDREVEEFNGIEVLFSKRLNVGQIDFVCSV